MGANGKPAKTQIAIKAFMWDTYKGTGKVNFTAQDLAGLAEMFSTMDSLRATVSAMRKRGDLIDTNTTLVKGRLVNQFTTAEILDNATMPQHEPHVNRPPTPSIAKSEFEKENAGRTRPTAKNAVGEEIKSVPAAEFTHYDNNVANGKLTGNRDPRKPVDADAVSEMVEHIRNTEGPTMATVPKPRHDSPEHAIAERDKRIERLENLLEKAIEQISRANREGLAKMETTNAERAEDLNALRTGMGEITDVIVSHGRVYDAALESMRESLSLTLNAILAIEGRNEAVMQEVYAGIHAIIEAGSNKQLNYAEGYKAGWVEGMKGSDRIEVVNALTRHAHKKHSDLSTLEELKRRLAGNDGPKEDASDLS